MKLSITELTVTFEKGHEVGGGLRSEVHFFLEHERGAQKEVEPHDGGS